MFWIFGSVEDSLPVNVNACLNVVWILWSFGLISLINPSSWICSSKPLIYVVTSFAYLRYSNTSLGTICSSASFSNTSADVEYPVLFFFPLPIPKWSNNTIPNCLGLLLIVFYYLC